MGAPSSDKAGIRQVIRALRAAGYQLVEVFDGEDTIKVKTEGEAVDAIMAVDDATLFVRTPDGQYNPWVRFVLGNDPEDLVCDYTINLSHAIEPVTDSWMED